MALNKAQTSLGVKIVLIIVAISMVGFLFPAIISMFSGSDSNSNANTNTATGTLDQIASKYNAQVAQNDATLAQDPANYAVLVAQGNTYFDWALDVMNAGQSNQQLLGADQPYWLSARQYYERALEATEADSPVETDLSIAYYYSGETTKAVVAVTKVTERDPKFASAWFNLGVFLGALGQNERAIAAYERALALDPTGQGINVEYAQGQLDALKGSASATTSP